MGKEFFAGTYMAAAAVLAIYFYRAIFRKDELGKGMARVLGAALVAVLSYVMYLCSNEYFLMSLGNSMVFASIDWILFFLLHFCAIFTEEQVRHPRLYQFITGILLIDNIHLLINPFREISMDYNIVTVGRYNYLVFQPKLLFHIHLGLCYIMVAAIVAVLVAKCVHVAKLYRVRYLFFAAAFFVVILGNMVFLLIGGNIDFSILTYAVLGIFLYFYAFDFKGTSAANAAKAYFVEEMNNPIIIFDYQGRMLMCNRRARELFTIDEAVTKDSFIEQQTYIHLTEEEDQSFETTIISKDHVYYFQIQYKLLRDKNERKIGTVFVYDDITDKKRAIIQNEYNATHDMLTGVYNRNFIAIFKDRVRREKLTPIFGAVYHLNGIRRINETKGTEIGDRALCRMAWMIQQFSRSTDYVIRTDGGEMLLLMPGESERKANEIFRKIERRITSFSVEDTELSAEFSYFHIESIDEYDRAYEETRREVEEKKKRKPLTDNSSESKSYREQQLLQN